MITKEDVKRGYEKGVVVFMNGAAFHGDGIVCCIGHRGWNYNWFYFAGHEGDDYTGPVTFVNDIGIDNVLDWVTDALNESIREVDEDEYAFYEDVLNEYKEETL